VPEIALPRRAVTSRPRCTSIGRCHRG
jgi:hypothetical protein